MNDNNYPMSLDELEQLFGPQDFHWFVNNLLVRLIDEGQQLQSCLALSEWRQAKSLAHQLKSVAYLAKDDCLLGYLEDIEQQIPLISSPAFQQKLQQSLDDFQAYLRQYIKSVER